MAPSRRITSPLSMLFSMMSTTALAFADETGDSTSVSTDVTDAPAAEEADAVDSGSSNDADSSDATSAPTITDVVDLTHESYEDANSNDETTQDATSDVVDGEETSESDANDTEVSTPETAEPTFVGLQTVTPEYGDKLITLSTCEYSRTNGRLVIVAKKTSPAVPEVAKSEK